ncbi:3-hydroxyacyl-CoA dehydrogenase [Anaplasma phagocytophilum]|uniref:3-hydroxyacyl-CoA dehydrogenase n=1 Tax=Anaplasma phagocytophilum TaxID=948 RepID=UPI00200E7F7E|nr:3-hydroxyacyl-CoA dehydrogenase [Anaplasma phagocytophilum]UQD53954.1 3-hydroxyacyl-CoA dehydrogenase [Anaplasma phagocytophilum]
MLSRKLAVVDPACSNVLLLRCLADSGIDLVLYCDNVLAGQSIDSRVRVRSLSSEVGALEDVSCVLELLQDQDKRARFYSGDRIRNSAVPLLSLGMSLEERSALRKSVSDYVLSRLVSVHLPTFFQPVPVFECILCDDNASSCSRVLSEFQADKLRFLTYSEGEKPLFDQMGCFWAVNCISAALEYGLDVEVADHIVTNDNTGVPLPGVFSILDQMGLDCFVSSLERLVGCLEKNDPMLELRQKLPEVIYGMISDGLTGINGRGGFYRTYHMRYGAMDQVIDLHSGLYRGLKKDMFLHESLLDKKCEAFSNAIWSRFLAYAEYISGLYGATIISRVDGILRIGYGWKYGVCEVASRLGMQCSLK